MTEGHDRASESPALASGAPADGSSAQPEPAAATSPDADVLSDVLRAVRLTGALFFPMRASSPWADEVPAAAAFASVVLPGARHVISYHIVREGRCWGALDGESPVALEAGDVLVIPHGDPYVMASDPDVRPTLSPEAVTDFFRQMSGAATPPLVIEGGGGPDGAELVCGFLACDTRPFNPVLDGLPRLIHLRGTLAAPAGDRLAGLLEFALAESQARRPGSRCVLLHLSELLFVEVIRQYLHSLPSGSTGWFAGLRDPMVGHALALLHTNPGEAWTLERLAREVASSRSSLVERFTALVGQPPMRYLTRWRVQRACGLLSDGTAKVSTIAREVGYQSEAAFSRAFKEIVGTSPARWRRPARAAVPVTPP